MSKVIEISDSEDEIATEPQPPTVEAPPPAVDPQPTAAVIGKVAVVSTATASSSTPVAAPTSSAARTRNRRKSVHQPMRFSPEMQFETIALDDDEDAAAATNKKNKARQESLLVEQHTKAAKAYKTTPTILGNKSARASFYADSEIDAVLREIAEERVRVNFLLASYSMPEIKFSLYTQPDVLQFQLQERLKQRQIRNLEVSRLREAKRKRSLLQSKA